MDVIAMLESMIRLDTVNPFRTVKTPDGREIGLGNGRYEIHELIEQRLASAGFNVRRQDLVDPEDRVSAAGEEIPRRYNVLAEKGEGDAALLLFGHLDTVDVKAGWDRVTALAPVRARRQVEDLGEREVLVGLGSNDMKAGLAVMLHTAEHFAEHCAKAGYRLKLAFLDDEECWSFGSYRLLEERDFLHGVQAALCPEIGDVAGYHRGARQIMLGRMGRAELEFSVPGRSTHGAFVRQSRERRNAVEDLGKLIVRLTAYCGEESRAEFLYDGERSISNAAYLNCAVGGRRMLSVPDRARLYLDRSFVPGESRSSELQRLRALVEAMYADGTLEPVVHGASEERIEVREAPRPTPASDPYHVPADHPFVTFVGERIQHLFGGEHRPLGGSKGGRHCAFGHSVADENVIANHNDFPVLVVGPTGRGSHEPGEWVDVQSVREVAAFYAEAIRCFGDYLRL